MRHSFTIVIFSLWILFGSRAVSAQTWIVGCEPDFPPYNYSEKDAFTGLDTELVEAVLNEVGVSYRIERFPWKRVMLSVDQATVDLAFQFVGKPERFNKYLMIGPLRSGITLFATQAGKPLKWNTLRDLTGKTIGTVKGFSYTPEFDQADYLTIDNSAVDNDQLLRKLLLGRVDVIIGDQNTLSFLAKRQGSYDQIEFSERILQKVPRYVAFPKSKADKAGRFAAGLNQIRFNGTYQEIIDRWK